MVRSLLLALMISLLASTIQAQPARPKNLMLLPAKPPPESTIQEYDPTTPLDPEWIEKSKWLLKNNDQWYIDVKKELNLQEDDEEEQED